MAKNKDFQRSEPSNLKQVIRELKAEIRRQDKIIHRMKGEIGTLQSALDKSIVYINDELANVPIEEIVRYFSKKKNGKLKEVNDLDFLKEKWSCHKCKVGYLRLILMERRDGKKYFRVCVNRTCTNRTRLQDWHPDVEGIKE